MAILVMRPESFIQTLISPSNGGSTLNLALIGQEVSKKIKFEFYSPFHSSLPLSI